MKDDEKEKGPECRGYTTNIRKWYTSKNELVVERGMRNTPALNCLDLQFHCYRFLEDHQEVRDDEGNVIIPAKPLTISRLCLYIGMDKTDFLNQVNKQFSNVKQYRWLFTKYKTTLFREMMAELEASRMENALSGKEKAQLAMFELKNLFPTYYKDKVEVAIEGDLNVLSIASLVREAEGEPIETTPDEGDDE